MKIDNLEQNLHSYLSQVYSNVWARPFPLFGIWNIADSSWKRDGLMYMLINNNTFVQQYFNFMSLVWRALISNAWIVFPLLCYNINLYWSF